MGGRDPHDEERSHPGSTRCFTTSAGVEVPAITTDQMREVDRVAIEEVGPNLYQMMENAGRNLALSAIDLLGPAWQSAPIVVLAGTGATEAAGSARPATSPTGTPTPPSRSRRPTISARSRRVPTGHFGPGFRVPLWPS